MMIRLSTLKKFNNKVKRYHTKKLYYGKFPYRLSFNIPGIFAIYKVRGKKDGHSYANYSIIDAALKYRAGFENLWTTNGKKSRYVSVDILNDLNNIYADVSNKVGCRMDYSNSIAFYFMTDKEMSSFFNKSKSVVGNFIKSISGPKNKKEEKLLKPGAVLVRNLKNYNFRIQLWSGHWPHKELVTLKNCASSTDCKIPKTLSGELNTAEEYNSRVTVLNTMFLWNRFIYAKDAKSVFYLRLMLGDKIRKVSRLVTPNK